ncbi:MAG: hypothetical protein Q9181_004226 [Wetmoreana brouardii]
MFGGKKSAAATDSTLALAALNVSADITAVPFRFNNNDFVFCYDAELFQAAVDDDVIERPGPVARADDENTREDAEGAECVQPTKRSPRRRKIQRKQVGKSIERKAFAETGRLLQRRAAFLGTVKMPS